MTVEYQFEGGSVDLKVKFEFLSNTKHERKEVKRKKEKKKEKKKRKEEKKRRKEKEKKNR